MITSIKKVVVIVGLFFAFLILMIPTVYAEQETITPMTVELTRKIEPGPGPGAEKADKPKQYLSNNQKRPTKTYEHMRYRKLLPQLGTIRTNFLGIGVLILILVIITVVKNKNDRVSRNEGK